MRTKSILSIFILTAVSITFGLNEAKAAFSAEAGSPNVNVRISDYQPAPRKHYKKEKKHYEDHGRGDGHERHGR